MDEQNNSYIVKAGSRTYFFDLKETREGQPFLVITESKFKGEGEERERASLVIFPDHAQEFSAATQEMAQKLGKVEGN